MLGEKNPAAGYFSRGSWEKFAWYLCSLGEGGNDSCFLLSIGVFVCPGKFKGFATLKTISHSCLSPKLARKGCKQAVCQE